MTVIGAKPISAGATGPIGVLDVGTSKVACLIAALGPAGGIEGHVPPVHVLGVGYQRSRGVKAGVVTDLDEAEHAVRAAVGQAERMAGLTLSSIRVSVACGRLRSQLFSANAEVEAGGVGAADIRRVMNGGRAYAEREGRTLVHLNRLGFRLDRAAAVSDPRGMAARLLSADLHAVTADEAPVRNLVTAVERCHLDVAGLVAAPYASALSSTTADERRLGVTAIDIGAGAATLAVFSDGHFVHAEAVPVGGNHLTYDIARALQAPLAEAERIKVLYGTLIAAGSDGHETFEYPLAGDEEGATNRATRAQLRAILEPRVAGTLSLIAERLARAEARGVVSGSIVLTGGASQLVGLPEFASCVFDRPVRAAEMTRIAGLPEGISRPSLAVATGLLAAASRQHAPERGWREDDDGNGGSYLGRVGNWLKAGF